MDGLPDMNQLFNSNYIGDKFSCSYIPDICHRSAATYSRLVLRTTRGNIGQPQRLENAEIFRSRNSYIQSDTNFL